MTSLIHKEISDKVRGAAFTVHDALGLGRLESAYEGALYVELNHLQLRVERQRSFPLWYRGEYIGAYIADIINPDFCSCGILELKEIAWVVPNFIISEYFVNFEVTSREIAKDAFTLEESYIALPTAPSLGLDLEEEALRAHPYRQAASRPLADERHDNL